MQEEGEAAREEGEATAAATAATACRAEEEGRSPEEGGGLLADSHAHPRLRAPFTLSNEDTLSRDLPSPCTSPQREADQPREEGLPDGERHLPEAQVHGAEEETERTRAAFVGPMSSGPGRCTC